MIENTVLLIFGVILFCIGLYAVISKRNAVKILIGIEIMIVAFNVIFIAFGTNLQIGKVAMLSYIFPLLSMTIGGATMAIGFSIVINNYRHTNAIDTDEMSTLSQGKLFTLPTHKINWSMILSIVFAITIICVFILIL